MAASLKRQSSGADVRLMLPCPPALRQQAGSHDAVSPAQAMIALRIQGLKILDSFAITGVLVQPCLSGGACPVVAACDALQLPSQGLVH